jgi:hypothetical protein
VYVHFLYLPKENEPKERAANHMVPRCGTTLRCLQRTGDIGKSLTLRRVAYPFFAVLLGGVQWRKKYFL